MNDREERKKKLMALAEESKKQTDELLADELNALKAATRTDLEKLRPKVVDEASYNKLISAVEESTRSNESLAQLKDRIEKLGGEVIRISKVAVKLLGSV